MSRILQLPSHVRSGHWQVGTFQRWQCIEHACLGVETAQPRKLPFERREDTYFKLKGKSAGPLSRLRLGLGLRIGLSGTLGVCLLVASSALTWGLLATSRSSEAPPPELGVTSLPRRLRARSGSIRRRRAARVAGAGRASRPRPLPVLRRGGPLGRRAASRASAFRRCDRATVTSMAAGGGASLRPPVPKPWPGLPQE